MLNQAFPVMYRDKCYMIDPSSLYNSSSKFKELIDSYINQNIDIRNLCLKITNENFSPRNIYNFLRICQNLPNDIQNSEVSEICEIAAMFQAIKIYETSINFLHSNIDKNFLISFDKFNNDHFLEIEQIEQKEHHQIVNFNDLEFDESYEYTQTEDTNNNNYKNNKSDETVYTKKNKSVLYQIKIERLFMKCRRFLFFSGEKILFTAKQKIHQIFIGDGNEIHINDKSKQKRAIITQSTDGFNMVNADDQSIKIIYCRTSPNQFKKKFSLYFDFMHCNSMVHWKPKPFENEEKLKGSYNRQPIHSKKNIILQNKAKHTTFILRKMNKQLYEAECHSTISPIIVFSIALSEIVGPFNI
ncbi:hypothetical protein M9Y10_004249 [Tritrichomonas musculus]|uniref:Tubby C-terminal domain-containing protein n=1 Tax=Tritrichomonas musculus TaxID=1915356 RepID=A0ABR2JRI4_9EUKA